MVSLYRQHITFYRHRHVFGIFRQTLELAIVSLDHFPACVAYEDRYASTSMMKHDFAVTTSHRGSLSIISATRSFIQWST